MLIIENKTNNLQYINKQDFTNMWQINGYKFYVVERIINGQIKKHDNNTNKLNFTSYNIVNLKMGKNKISEHNTLLDTTIICESFKCCNHLAIITIMRNKIQLPNIKLTYRKLNLKNKYGYEYYYKCKRKRFVVQNTFSFNKGKKWS